MFRMRKICKALNFFFSIPPAFTSPDSISGATFVSVAYMKL